MFPAKALELARLLADPERHWKQGASALPSLPEEPTGSRPPSRDTLRNGAPWIVGAEILLALPELEGGPTAVGRPAHADGPHDPRAHTGRFAGRHRGLEGKVDEPFGDLVGDGGRRAPSPGRRSGSAFLLRLLELGHVDPDGLRYQLLHRTAAALIEANRFGAECAVMLVQPFSPEHRSWSDFVAFAEALGDRGRGVARWSRPLARTRHVCCSAGSRTTPRPARKTTLPREGRSGVSERPDDAEDARLLAAGDFGGVIARHYDALLARARVRLREGEAQDVVQDAVIRVLRDLDRRGGFDHPIRVVLHRRLGWQIADHIRGRSPETPLPPDWDRPDEEPGYREVDSRDYLDEVFSHLTAPQRRIAEAHYFEGLSIQEIAARDGMTRNAVDQALFRVHRRLRDLVDA